MKVSKADKDHSLEMLNKFLNKNQTVYCVLRHVSRSGVRREIALFVIHENRMQVISGWVSDVLEMPINRDNLGIKIDGCGMDMGFHVVYNLASVLYGNGYQLKSEWL